MIGIRRGLLLVALAWACGPAVATGISVSSPVGSRPAPLSFSEAVDLDAWGLNETEAKRYRELMRGVRGAFSQPNISPLEVLGIHARTPAERRRYAERLVRLLYEDTERVLAFQREVQAAWERLYGDVPIVDTSRLPPESRPFSPDLFDGKRLAAFVSTTCGACDRAMPRFLALMEGGAKGIDFYVVDTSDDDAIRAWARRHGIPVEAVRSRRITLNHGRSLFARLGGTAVPALFVRDGDAFTPVPALDPPLVREDRR